MEIKHLVNGQRGEFYMEENGKRVAFLSYVFAGETKFIIEHTVVDSVYEGKGLGKQLVNAAVGFARKNGYKILPLCPYAKRVMEGSEAYKDVLF